VLEGVKAGDRIVVEGIVKLKDGAKISDAATPGAGKGAAPAPPAAANRG
jgi:membrane fusion protein (multidrug efflux system)